MATRLKKRKSKPNPCSAEIIVLESPEKSSEVNTSTVEKRTSKGTSAKKSKKQKKKENEDLEEIVVLHSQKASLDTLKMLGITPPICSTPASSKTASSNPSLCNFPLRKKPSKRQNRPPMINDDILIISPLKSSPEALNPSSVCEPSTCSLSRVQNAHKNSMNSTTSSGNYRACSTSTSSNFSTLDRSRCSSPAVSFQLEDENFVEPISSRTRKLDIQRVTIESDDEVQITKTVEGKKRLSTVKVKLEVKTEPQEVPSEVQAQTVQEVSLNVVKEEVQNQENCQNSSEEEDRPSEVKQRPSEVEGAHSDRQNASEVGSNSSENKQRPSEVEARSSEDKENPRLAIKKEVKQEEEEDLIVMKVLQKRPGTADGGIPSKKIKKEGQENGENFGLSDTEDPENPRMRTRAKNRDGPGLYAGCENSGNEDNNEDSSYSDGGHAEEPSEPNRTRSRKKRRQSRRNT